MNSIQQHEWKKKRKTDGAYSYATNYEGFTILLDYLLSSDDMNPMESMEERKIYRMIDNNKQHLRDKLFRFSFCCIFTNCICTKEGRNHRLTSNQQLAGVVVGLSVAERGQIEPTRLSASTRNTTRRDHKLPNKLHTHDKHLHIHYHLMKNTHTQK